MRLAFQLAEVKASYGQRQQRVVIAPEVGSPQRHTRDLSVRLQNCAAFGEGAPSQEAALAA